MTIATGQHVDAVIALIESVGQVFDGNAPNLTNPPWINVYTDSGIHRPSDLALNYHKVHVTIYLVGVGGTRWQATNILDNARNLAIGNPVAIAGLNSGQIRHRASQSPHQSSTDPDIWEQTEQWTVTTYSASET